MDAETQQSREAAADSSGYVEQAKSAFRAGWNAAMEHVERERQIAADTVLTWSGYKVSETEQSHGR